LENEVTGNLLWTIEQFGKEKKGFLTFPTKFNMIEPLLPLSHNGRIIVRMSVNPEEIIKKIEFGTSPLLSRIEAVNRLCEAGYKTGLIIAPVVMLPGWKELYAELIETLRDKLSITAKKQSFIEVIFMTYSYVHRMINRDAFPNAVELYDKGLMTGRGRGRYCYRQDAREDGEQYLRTVLARLLPECKIEYIV
ncbi:MAG: spore photoproduct lyase, partial [Bacillota bacterium]|nr:spore photoproduct lyase [Bacillota bacterium]